MATPTSEDHKNEAIAEFLESLTDILDEVKPLVTFAIKEYLAIKKRMH